MSTLLSLLGIGAAAQLLAVDDEAKLTPPAAPPKPLPKFKKRWWWANNMVRLDARPVAWSLKNHPEQWQQIDHERVMHLPSRHTFRTDNGPYALYSARCYCQSSSARNYGSFYYGQSLFTFGATYLQWREWDQGVGRNVPRSYESNEPKNVSGQTPHEHFAAHFVN